MYQATAIKLDVRIAAVRCTLTNLQVGLFAAIRSVAACACGGHNAKRKDGPKETSSRNQRCRGAARQTGLSLQTQNPSCGQFTDRGQTRLLLTRLLLAQHFLARAERLLLQYSASHRSSHSRASIWLEPKLNFRRSPIFNSNADKLVNRLI